MIIENLLKFTVFSINIFHQQNMCDLDGSKGMILMSVTKNAQPKKFEDVELQE